MEVLLELSWGSDCVYLRPRFDCQAEICQFLSRFLAAHSLSDIVLAMSVEC